MKQHVLSVLLILSLLLSMLPFGVQAEENGLVDSAAAVSEGSEEASLEALSGLEAPNGYTLDESASRLSYPKRTATEGICGEALTWSFSDGELVISGTGAMTEFEGMRDAPWYAHGASVKKVTIRSGVTSVSQFAFCELTGLDGFAAGYGDCDRANGVCRLRFADFSRASGDGQGDPLCSVR